MNDKLIETRKAGLEQFAKESYPVIVDFAERLDYPDPSSILLDNTKMSYFLGTVHKFMKNETVDEDTQVWIKVRIGYLIGEYLIQKHNGYWGVNENPDSLQFGHYVVFAVSSDKKKVYPVDVFETANHFISQESPRDLVGLIDEIEGVIK